ncbi:NUDIX domain-containing protein [Pseudarcicella hirudinis]|uniref:NUDIX domain-containing protein n=1 Tax=Pseudarcicella hirudinis TaxID=1079859 RepID=A0A1I5RD66_9BACT|nr:NUDIX domain-containing protein [Pseudarcicella hirudinis]SFP56251.1 NUDIX domain-containing protein [Pseudarcicella hirudinis]
MIIFINDRPIKIVGEKKAKQIQADVEYDRLIDAQLEVIKPESLSGHVLLLNVTNPTIERLFRILEENPLSHLQSIVLFSKNPEETKAFIKGLYQVIKAGGGVVRNVKGELLLMYRYKKWDLPKGKLERNEKPKDGAVREVEEECNVRVALGKKICTTYHTYTQKSERILKQTKWYEMDLLDDSKMKPQIEENIEKLSWMERKEIRVAMLNSYTSIRYVLETYYEAED